MGQFEDFRQGSFFEFDIEVQVNEDYIRYFQYRNQIGKSVCQLYISRIFLGVGGGGVKVNKISKNIKKMIIFRVSEDAEKYFYILQLEINFCGGSGEGQFVIYV